MDNLCKAAQMKAETKVSNGNAFYMVFNALSKEPYDANMDFSYELYDSKGMPSKVKNYCNNHYQKYHLYNMKVGNRKGYINLIDAPKELCDEIYNLDIRFNKNIDIKFNKQGLFITIYHVTLDYVTLEYMTDKYDNTDITSVQMLSDMLRIDCKYTNQCSDEYSETLFVKILSKYLEPYSIENVYKLYGVSEQYNDIFVSFGEYSNKFVKLFNDNMEMLNDAFYSIFSDCILSSEFAKLEIDKIGEKEYLERVLYIGQTYTLFVDCLYFVDRFYKLYNRTYY